MLAPPTRPESNPTASRVDQRWAWRRLWRPRLAGGGLRCSTKKMSRIWTTRLTELEETEDQSSTRPRRRCLQGVRAWWSACSAARRKASRSPPVGPGVRGCSTPSCPLGSAQRDEGVSRMLTKARRNNPRSNAAHDRNRIDRLRHAHLLSQTWAVAYLVRHFARENCPSRKPRWKVRSSTTSLPHKAGHDPACACRASAFPLIQFRIPRCLRDFFGWLALRTTGLSRRERSKPRGKKTRLQSQIAQRRRSP